VVLERRAGRESAREEWGEGGGSQGWRLEVEEGGIVVVVAGS